MVEHSPRILTSEEKATKCVITALCVITNHASSLDCASSLKYVSSLDKLCDITRPCNIPLLYDITRLMRNQWTYIKYH